MNTIKLLAVRKKPEIFQHLTLLHQGLIRILHKLSELSFNGWWELRSIWSEKNRRSISYTMQQIKITTICSIKECYSTVYNLLLLHCIDILWELSKNLSGQNCALMTMPVISYPTFSIRINLEPSVWRICLSSLIRMQFIWFWWVF